MKAESLLVNYLERVKELYSATGILDEKFPDEMEEINHDLERSISKLKLLSLIHEKYVVGISGFQGAGKTTLMNRFLFDNPLPEEDNWLPENLGIGENLPVLITVEKQKEKVEAILYEVEKRSENDGISDQNIVNKKTIMQPLEVQKIVKQPENNYLLLELIVPMPNKLLQHKRSSILDGTSFLLLPGYEIIDDEMEEIKRYRQEYMRLALRACANSIIVLDPRKVMQKEKEEVLTEITTIFKDTGALYVLSHCENGKKVNEIEYLQKKFNVNTNFIIESGTETETFTRKHIDDWRNKLIEKLADDAVGNNQIREFQKNNISKIILECTKLIRKVERLKEKIEIEISEDERKLEKYFDTFDKAVIKISEKYFDIYDTNVDKFLNETYKTLDEENYGEIRKRIYNWFVEKFKGPEPISKIAGAFSDVLRTIIDKQGGDNTLLLKVYNQTQNELGVYSDLKNDGDLVSLKENALEKITPNQNYQLNAGVIRNIQFLAGSDKTHTKTDKLNEPDGDFDNAMEILPYLVFDSQRFQLISDGKSLLNIFKDKEYAPASDSFMEHFGKAQINVKSFLTGIVALAGADFLPDGKLNNIGSLVTALFGSSKAAAAGKTATTAATAVVGGKTATTGATAAAAGGTSVLGVMTGVAVGLIILNSINNATIQHGLKKMNTLFEIKDYQSDQIKSDIRNNFYTTFQRVRDLIQYRLKKYAFSNYNVGYKLKLKNRIQNCSIAYLELNENLRKEN